MVAIEDRIRELQNLYYKWQNKNPESKIDIDACKGRIEMLNNVFLVWLKKRHKEYGYEQCKELFVRSMNFLTRIDDKIADRQQSSDRQQTMKKKITNG